MRSRLPRLTEFKGRSVRVVSRFSGAGVIIALWFVATSFSWVDSLFLPSPIAVVKAIGQLFVKHNFLSDILATLYRLVVGFGIGAVSGVSVGMVVGYYRKLFDVLEFPLDFARSIAVATLAPLFVLVFGLGDASKFAIAAWSSSLIILFGTLKGVQNCRKTRIMAARTMGTKRGRLFVRVILPEALPEILVGLRQGASIAIIVVVLSEMILGGSPVGLGQRVLNESLQYHVDAMYGAIIFAGILGFAINKFFAFIERRVVHWAGK